MFASEFGDGPRRPAGEISDDARDGHGFSTSTLVRGDRESALDDGRGIPSRTRRPRASSGDSSTKRRGLPIVAPMISAACRYDIASLPVRTYFLPRCPGCVIVTKATAAMSRKSRYRILPSPEAE